MRATMPHMLPTCHALEAADIGEAGEELQSAAAMLQSDEQGAPAIQLLSRVLGNIIASPSDPKFRCAHVP